LILPLPRNRQVRIFIYNTISHDCLMTFCQVKQSRVIGGTARRSYHSQTILYWQSCPP
jgi:hypothetical protein